MKPSCYITTSTNYPVLNNGFRKARRARLKKDSSGLKGVGLEGASRSGKSWDICVFICDYVNTFTGKTINICRDSLTNLRLTAMVTLKTVWAMHGMPLGQFNKTTTQIRYRGNTINFVGVNDNLMKAHGLESDVLWANEKMGIA